MRQSVAFELSSLLFGLWYLVVLGLDSPDHAAQRILQAGHRWICWSFYLEYACASFQIVPDCCAGYRWSCLTAGTFAWPFLRWPPQNWTIYYFGFHFPHMILSSYAPACRIASFVNWLRTRPRFCFGSDRFWLSLRTSSSSQISLQSGHRIT